MHQNWCPWEVTHLCGQHAEEMDLDHLDLNPRIIAAIKKGIFLGTYLYAIGVHLCGCTYVLYTLSKTNHRGRLSLSWSLLCSLFPETVGLDWCTDAGPCAGCLVVCVFN